MVSSTIYPESKWVPKLPGEAGFDPRKLDSAKRWLDDRVGKGRYRVVIIRGGHLVSEWNHGFLPNKRRKLISAIKSAFKHSLRRRGKDTAYNFNQDIGSDQQLPLASAAKSIFSCILGIAIQEGKIPSADAKIVDFYPEAMDVSEGYGPKPGRYAFEKDRAITFRQLISNTSGYMKPGEDPGKVFHYQTYGMNILTHAIAKTYGLYDIQNPKSSPGFKQLVNEKLRIPIGASWSYQLMNFNLQPKARIDIFGYYDGINSSALDMARLGWLWCNLGRWEDKQLVPEQWLREATRTAPEIIANCPKEQWRYGYGFWTNDHYQLWPDLPGDSFAASGAGGQHIWVCPSVDLVVVQSPGILKNHGEYLLHLLKMIVNASS